MHVRILDLDDSILRQGEVLRHYRPQVIPLGEWGPAIRMGCGFRRFRRFEQALGDALGCTLDDHPQVTLYGSGDFHHVSLALLRRQPRPFNLLMIDNHPDWMRGIPFLHCGTWLYHAARLPMVQRIFHVGGEVDFDNGFRWLVPWPELCGGKITVFPAFRRFQRGAWRVIAHEPLRTERHGRVCPERLEKLIAPCRSDLAACPLYISLDKDVLTEAEATVNWDSGHLTIPEVQRIVRRFIDAAQGNLAGADLLGDWSPVRVRGALRKTLHLTEHPALAVNAAAAAWRNTQTNLALLETIISGLAPKVWAPGISEGQSPSRFESGKVPSSG
jgi:hypothetical protein